MGGKFVNFDNREVPDTLEVMWHYPGDTLVTFSQFNASAAPASARSCDIEFRGTKGILYLYSRGYEVVPEVITPHEFYARTPLDRSLERRYRQGAKPMIEPKKGVGHQETVAHVRNFLDCVRSRAQCHCDIETGHRSTTATLIANIAHKLKRYLEWDADREQFANCPEANRYLSYEYRKPYRLGPV